MRACVRACNPYPFGTAVQDALGAPAATASFDVIGVPGGFDPVADTGESGAVTMCKRDHPEDRRSRAGPPASDGERRGSW